MLERLANVPDMHGDTVAMRVINRLMHNDITQFLDITGPITRLVNDKTRTNIAHLILANRKLDSVEKLKLIDLIVLEDLMLGFCDF